MIRIFSIILFIIISNKVTATIQGEALICNQDKIGYNFIDKDKVNVYVIDVDAQDIISIKHSYRLNTNAILIQQPLTELNVEKKNKPVGWIFRRSLDYVSLNYVNGDLNRKFLWRCEITSTNQLYIKLENKLEELIKAIEKK